MKLNMSKFKKVSSDKTHTIMRHEDGHEMKIAHKALSPKMRKQFQELPAMMADGGEAEKGKYVDPKAAKEVTEGASESGWQPHQWVQNLKEGLGIGDKKMADGGEVAATGPYIDPKKARANEEDSQKSGFQPHEWVKNVKEGLGIATMADGGEAEPMSVATSPQQVQAPQAPITINVGGAQPAAPQPFNMDAITGGNQPYGLPPQAAPAQVPMPASNVIPEQPTAAAAPQPEAPAPTQEPQPTLAPQAPAAPQQQDQFGTQAYADNYTKGLNEQRAGIAGTANAQMQQGQGEAQALNTAAAVQQQALQDYKSHVSALDQERQGFIKDIQDQHIDPNHYLNSQDNGKRLSTVIGLIFGGAPAQQFLHDQINRDIDAQKANIGKSENLLTANLKQFGNMRDATDMTRVMMNDIASNQIKVAAAKAMTPMAKAAALQSIGKLDQESAATMSQIAMRKSLGNLSMSGGGDDSGRIGAQIQVLRQINPAMAKSLEERYVPSVGVAQVPVPQEVRSTLIAKQQLQNMATDFYKWSEQHSGSLDPRITAEGRTKAAELQSLYRNSINGGVFKKGEQEFIDQIVDSDPNKFFNKVRVLPKLKEVINSNNAQLNTLKKGYGLPATTQIQESAPVK